MPPAGVNKRKLTKKLKKKAATKKGKKCPPFGYSSSSSSSTSDDYALSSGIPGPSVPLVTYPVPVIPLFPAEEIIPELNNRGESSYITRLQRLQDIEQRSRDIHAGSPLPEIQYPSVEVREPVLQGVREYIDRMVSRAEAEMLDEGQGYSTAILASKFNDGWTRNWNLDEGHTTILRAQELEIKFQNSQGKHTVGSLIFIVTFIIFYIYYFFRYAQFVP